MIIALLALPLLGAMTSVAASAAPVRRLAVAIPVLESLLAIAAPPAPVTLLGVALAPEPTGRFLIVIASLAALPVLSTPTDAAIATDPRPVALVALSAAALSCLASGNLLVSSLAMATTGVILTLVLVDHDGKALSARTTSRYLVWLILASTALSISAAFSRLYEQQAATGVLGPGAALFVVGIGVFVGALPFSLWLLSLCDEAPLAASLVISLLSCAAAAVLDTNVSTRSLVLTEISLRGVLAVSGGVGAVAGAFVATGEQRAPRVLAYLIGANADLALTGLAVLPNAVSGAVVWLLGTQALAAAIVFACLASSSCNRVGPADDSAGLTGLLWRRPVLSSALLIGTLSLIGMPLTAGFIGRWALGQATTPWHSILSLCVLAATVLGGLAFSRSFGTVFAATEAPAEPPGLFDLIVAGLAVLLVLGGIHPWPSFLQLR